MNNQRGYWRDVMSDQVWRAIRKRKGLAPLNVESHAKIVPLLADPDPRIVPLTIGDEDIIPLTFEDERIEPPTIEEEY